MRNSSLAIAFLAVVLPASARADDRFTVEKGDDGVAVLLDGKLFTKYLTSKGMFGKAELNKPILWPIVGPTGKEMTRPPGPGDHPHHTSLWLTHDRVAAEGQKAADFWHIQPETRIVTDKIEDAKGGQTAVIKATNKWMVGTTPIAIENRTMEFGVDKDGTRWIDVDVAIAPAGKAITFGATKEGFFGVRVPPAIVADKSGKGTIVNSKGQKNADAWSKQAEWVDYYGDIDGETVGIAILNHPSSFRFPTLWHVRTYGLFAANPFMKEAHTIEPGQSLRLRHRVLLHRGDTEKARISDAFERYMGSASK